MRFLIVIVLVAVALAACSSSAESVGSSAAPLVTPYTDQVSTTPGQTGFTAPFAAQEPSGAFANFATLVGGMNTNSTGNMGWMNVTASGTVVTLTSTCDMSGLGSAGCTAIPLGGTGVLSFSADPTVVSDGLGNVVYIGLADTNGKSEGSDGDEVAVAAVSTNAGATFDGLTVVNGAGCGTGGYVVDQPDATFDYTTSPPTLWVTYRFRASSAGTYGACIRRGVIDTTVAPATISWLDPALDIQGIGTGGVVGVGGIRVAAGDGVVTVGFSSSADITSCPTINTKALDWGTVNTYDNGQTWVDNAKIFDSGDFHWCVANGAIDMGLRSFDITRAPGGMTYAVIAPGGLDTGHDAMNLVRVFKSPASGIKGFQSADTNKRSWFEWCAGTPTSTVTGAPTTNWRNVEVDGPCSVPAFTGTGPSVAMPVIAADGLGRLAVTYYETVDATEKTIRVMFQGNVNPQDPATGWQALPLTTTFLIPTGGFGRPIGDYMAIAIKPSTRVAPLFLPGCTAANDFFPLWVQSAPPVLSATPTPEVATTGVTLTPL